MEDLTGKKFGKLIVLEFSYEKFFNCGTKHNYWLCKCECGNKKIISANNLKNNHTQSCGCLPKEKAKNNFTTHNLSNTLLYRKYSGIKRRCYNKNEKSYNNYGGRGIIMCDEWKNDFKAFYDWSMMHGYADNLTIDRIDVNGNYEPNNCRWITNKEQQNNKRNNHYITYNNETHTITEWAKKLNISVKALSWRVNNKKWSLEKAMTYNILT